MNKNIDNENWIWKRTNCTREKIPCGWKDLIIRRGASISSLLSLKEDEIFSITTHLPKLSLIVCWSSAHKRNSILTATAWCRIIFMHWSESASLTTRIYWQYGKGSLWQRGYHDHFVRNEEDFFECLKYIKENPLKKNLENWQFVGRVDYLR